MREDDLRAAVRICREYNVDTVWEAIETAEQELAYLRLIADSIALTGEDDQAVHDEIIRERDALSRQFIPPPYK